MTQSIPSFDRLVAAIERLSPEPPAATDWSAHPAFVVGAVSVRHVERLAAPDLSLLRGIERQKQLVAENVLRHARGHAAHDMLLWGARGMGKSALLRAATIEAQRENDGRLALVQIEGDALHRLPGLVSDLRAVVRRFLLYFDDLGFADGSGDDARLLRSWLDGGIEPRPGNVRLAVTSNRRDIVARHMSEQDDPINPRDMVDDQLALADRFGLSVGFHACSQDDYLTIIAGYADHFGLEWTAADALEWTKRRGSRSGRTAWHYVNELAGRVGRTLDTP